MSAPLDHISATTFHGRKSSVENAFRYSIDYVLLDAERGPSGPWLFSRNGRNLAALNDGDHGGAPGQGSGAAWVRQVLETHGLAVQADQILLLAQPKLLGHVFNPVSFWLIYDASRSLRVVIAEVSNTFGDRHCYLCHHNDLRPITADETLRASKIFHVSPFQKIEGSYSFRFDITDQRIGIWIDYQAKDMALMATLTGKRRSMTNRSILTALLRRPFGSRRVLALIHWQALKLWWKGAVYAPRPEPPSSEVS